jgi:hypothetical protein
MLEADHGTILSYQAEAQIGGKLAQIGARLIDGVAKNDGQRVFRKLRSGYQK